MRFTVYGGFGGRGGYGGGKEPLGWGVRLTWGKPIAIDGIAALVWEGCTAALVIDGIAIWRKPTCKLCLPSRCVSNRGSRICGKVSPDEPAAPD